MNWAVLGTIFCILTVVTALVLRADLQKEIRQVCTTLCLGCAAISIAFLVPCICVTSTIHKRYQDYLDLKEKVGATSTDSKKYQTLVEEINQYNQWYEKNKKKLRDPWEIESVYLLSDQFEYIELK